MPMEDLGPLLEAAPLPEPPAAANTDVPLPDRADQGEVRRNNLELVLRQVLIRRDSRAGIAARTGLTRATVSRLVSELMASGLLREDGQHVTGHNGRPGTALVVDGRHVFGVGAEINVDHLGVLICDLAGNTVYEHREAFSPRRSGPEATLRTLAQLCLTGISAATQSLPRTGPDAVRHQAVVAGVSSGVAGIVDADAGLVVYAPNLGWYDVQVRDALRAELGMPDVDVRVGNEANIAASAEVKFGEYAGASELVYIDASVGIGGGIIGGGGPLFGRRGHGGEAGHIPLSVDGPVCNCGRRGCWEAYIGLDVVLRDAGLADEAVTGQTAALDEKVARLSASAEAGDERTLSALERAGFWLGVGAATLANILNPRVVIVGGYIVSLAEWMMPAARRSYDERVFGVPSGLAHFVVSQLGLSVPARGSASLMIDFILADPTRLSQPSQNAEVAVAAMAPPS